jgi:2-amino-4-hydroxy-6-hydroxymethyldihydropteridine diphosphokinase
MRAWIGLGGNREDSRELLGEALRALSAAPLVELRRRSRWYQTRPWGGVEQPEFVNAVAELETGLDPVPLLRLLLDVETRLGRERTGARWGPRCVDLDLLTYGQLILQSEELVLPHPQMHRRAFVLLPLLELEPGFEIPGLGRAAGCLQDIEPGETVGVLPLSPRREE